MRSDMSMPRHTKQVCLNSYIFDHMNKIFQKRYPLSSPDTFNLPSSLLSGHFGTVFKYSPFYFQLTKVTISPFGNPKTIMSQTPPRAGIFPGSLCTVPVLSCATVHNHNTVYHGYIHFSHFCLSIIFKISASLEGPPSRPSSFMISLRFYRERRQTTAKTTVTVTNLVIVESSRLLITVRNKM